MPEALPRYSRRHLPAQRYLPGRAPRPNEPVASSLPLDPARWWQCEDFLYGVDLWNHGFFWEAHEAWEAPWRAAGRNTGAGRVLQGLILLAAAAVKRELDASEAARRLALRGAAMLRRAGTHRALDLPAFAAKVEAWVREETSEPPRLTLPAAALRAEMD